MEEGGVVDRCYGCIGSDAVTLWCLRRRDGDQLACSWPVLWLHRLQQQEAVEEGGGVGTDSDEWLRVVTLWCCWRRWWASPT